MARHATVLERSFEAAGRPAGPLREDGARDFGGVSHSPQSAGCREVSHDANSRVAFRLEPREVMQQW